jgi:hypothetical protein
MTGSVGGGGKTGINIRVKTSRPAWPELEPDWARLIKAKPEARPSQNRAKPELGQAGTRPSQNLVKPEQGQAGTEPNRNHCMVSWVGWSVGMW